jgi:hypothetical protein
MSHDFHSALQPDAAPIEPNAALEFAPTSAQFLTPEILSVLLRMQTPAKQPETAGPSVRGAWSAQEDELLVTAVKQLGTKKWIDVTRFVPTRTSKQCRERWFHRLSPEIRHDAFEPWEDHIILDSQRELGNRWSLIAQRIPGRSACSVKNRWYSGLKNQHPIHAQLDLGALDHCLIGGRPEHGINDDGETHSADL